MALVTSANISKAAQRRNMEAGVLIRHPLMVDRLYNYFVGAIDKGVLERLVT
jgi:phosphatidylserine/phosphatidylglycerophosphate/cardiolipin synthase-like enzyme